MTQLTFRDCAVPLSILFMCMALNVAFLENFQTRAFMSADKDETQGYTKMKPDVGGNWDRSLDNILQPEKKFESPESISQLKTLSLFSEDDNNENNTDLTNWASFDPLVGLNSKISNDVVGSFAQVTNHKV